MHPMKEASILSAENKHRSVVGQTDKMEGPYKKALRISGTQPQTMEPVPEQGVPQFENDRSPRDVAYGSISAPVSED